MSNKISQNYEVVLNGDKIIIKSENSATYLPPARNTNAKATSRTDFCLLGKAIVNNLGFSELPEEIKKIKKEK